MKTFKEFIAEDRSAEKDLRNDVTARNYKQNSKAERILKFIAQSPEGKTLREIQMFIIRMNFNRDWEIGDRGYYSTNLTGTGNNKGLLGRYCEKRISVENGRRTVRWVVTKPIEPPYYPDQNSGGYFYQRPY